MNCAKCQNLCDIHECLTMDGALGVVGIAVIAIILFASVFLAWLQPIAIDVKFLILIHFNANFSMRNKLL